MFVCVWNSGECVCVRQNQSRNEECHWPGNVLPCTSTFRSIHSVKFHIQLRLLDEWIFPRKIAIKINTIYLTVNCCGAHILQRFHSANDWKRHAYRNGKTKSREKEKKETKRFLLLWWIVFYVFSIFVSLLLLIINWILVGFKCERIEKRTITKPCTLHFSSNVCVPMSNTYACTRKRENLCWAKVVGCVCVCVRCECALLENEYILPKNKRFCCYVR